MPKLSLKTHKGARNQLSKLIEQYKLKAENDLTPPHMRTLCYAFQVLSSYYKLDLERELLERVEALEEFAEQKGYRRAER